MKHPLLYFSAVLASSIIIELANAQQNNIEYLDDNVEEVRVIGSYVPHDPQYNSPSPIQSISNEAILASGAKSVVDLVQTLTINSGSENNPDAFTQAGTTGTSNFNLRALGVASTLVLLNGQRQVVSGHPTNDGINFVDTNALLPLIAVKNIDILKDGASGLYGSDAVAGVVNFNTRDNFDGIEVSLDYQQIVEEGDSDESVAQILIGHQTDKGGLIAALSYLERSPLTTAERQLSRPQDDSSVLGNPGAFLGVPGLPANAPIIDPGCADAGGIPQVLVADVGGSGFDVGTCGFTFGDSFNLVAEEERLNTFLRGHYDFNHNIHGFAEVAYSRTEAARNNSPSFPLLNPTLVPANNPGNFFNAPVLFLGRVIGNGGDPAVSNYEFDTTRFAAGVKKDSIDSSLGWEFNVVYARNEGLSLQPDAVTNNLVNALNGFGGSNCTGPADPNAQAGIGDCEFFNPFSSAFSTLPNSQNVINSIFETQQLSSTSELQSFQGLVFGELFTLGDNTISFALGAQYRNEELEHDYDDLSNQDAFTFVVGNSDFLSDRDVSAVFFELAVPVTEQINAQLAVRYEDYGDGIGDTTNPKIALVYTPNDSIQLRGGFSTAFRAPSIFQVSGNLTVLEQVTDPISPQGNAGFVATRTMGNSQLAPEDVDVTTLGGTFNITEALSLDLDYWHFDVSNAIIQENSQAVINAFSQDSSRVIRAGDPLTGQITRVNLNFINASSIDTDGIDFTARYDIDTSIGSFQPFMAGTYILNYDISDPQAGDIDGAGQRNFNNFGTSTPQLRINTGITWTNGAHTFNVFGRFIDSYNDDQNCANDTSATNGQCPDDVPLRKINSIITYDLQYHLKLAELLGNEHWPALTIGGINVSGQTPPQVFTNGGFDSKVHDPRGRLYYAKLTFNF